jgi:hypothetical protein
MYIVKHCIHVITSGIRFLWLLIASADWISSTFGGTEDRGLALRAGGRSLKSTNSQFKILSTTFFCRVGIPLPREISVEALLRDDKAAASDDGAPTATEPLAALDTEPADVPAAVKTAVSAGREAELVCRKEQMMYKYLLY